MDLYAWSKAAAWLCLLKRDPSFRVRRGNPDPAEAYPTEELHKDPGNNSELNNQQVESFSHLHPRGIQAPFLHPFLDRVPYCRRRRRI
mmetsp:Transcript_40310/g.66958  ORF Transcript_40310/g.66958 Transcript_40310/m.66958 type:complete len:88 (+) Transcript_40310:346-609(+)